MMEQLNRVNLVGKVGRFRIQNVGDTQVLNVSVSTSLQYLSRDGQAITETQWTDVVAWRGRNVADFGFINENAWVSVEGRIRTRKWTDRDGATRYSTEVLASKLAIVDGPLSPQSND